MGWFSIPPKYILTKFRDAKLVNDIFDIIEKSVILCLLEMSALGTTFIMTVSLKEFSFILLLLLL